MYPGKVRVSKEKKSSDEIQGKKNCWGNGEELVIPFAKNEPGGLRMLPAISVNKGCCSPQPLQPLPTVHPKETEDEQTQDIGPRKQRCMTKE